MSSPSDLPPSVAALPRVIASTPGPHPLRPGSPRAFFTAARRRIVVAVDFSGDSAYAVTWAVDNQIRPGDAVVVLHVLSNSVTLAYQEHEAEAAACRREADVDGLTSKAEDLEAVVDSLTASKAKHQAAAAAPARMREADVDGLTSKAKDVEAVVDSLTVSKVKHQAEPLNHAAEIRSMLYIVRDDDTKRRICDEVRRLNTTLLIMGSKGTGAATGLGSVADYCVRHCVCPVVVVRPPGDGGIQTQANGKGMVVYSRREKKVKGVPVGSGHRLKLNARLIGKIPNVIESLDGGAQSLDSNGKGIKVYSRRKKTGLRAEESENVIENMIDSKCSVSEAIDQAILEKKLFVVYISGDEETSRRMEAFTLLHESVIQVISKSCIFLKLNHGNDDEREFSAMHPQKITPSLSVFGMDGAMLCNHEGYISPGDLNESIETAWAALLLQAAQIALIYDERMLDHIPPNDGDLYFEVPERLTAIYATLEKDGILKSCHVYKAKLARVDDLLAVHTRRHVNEVLSISEDVQCEDEEKAKSQGNQIAGLFADKELYHSSGTKRAILLAAGGAVQACSMVARGIHRTAFALIRPPGHHASRDKAGGFCFINNLAVGAGVLLNEHKMDNVLALDWDIHHGDGTQNIFLADKRVLTFSLHRSAKSFYPPSEKREVQIGHGSGKGYNVNICWGGPHVKDDDFYYVWKHVLMPMAREFKPKIILIACGFDAARGDQLGKCCVTPMGYATLLNELNELSIELKIGLVMILEGGYNLKSIGNSASACLKVLSGDKRNIEDINKCKPRPSTLKTVNMIREQLGPYWSVLRPPED